MNITNARFTKALDRRIKVSVEEAKKIRVLAQKKLDAAYAKMALTPEYKTYAEAENALTSEFYGDSLSLHRAEKALHATLEDQDLYRKTVDFHKALHLERKAENRGGKTGLNMKDEKKVLKMIDTYGI